MKLIPKLIFKLCWKHNNCVKATLKMEYPLCNIRKCLVQITRPGITAYKKTITKAIRKDK